MQRFFAIILAVMSLSLAAADKFVQEREAVNRQIWSRFISKEGVMYDYAGLKGEVVLPTPEECAKNIPNALAWWTPVENGGFFNGMYLISQCERYETNPTPENREKVKTLVHGLYLLQDVGKTPGFIARGVGSDGKCHYPASSNDQNFPWFMGLGRYLKTDIPTAAERKDCADRMVKQAKALQVNNWRIVGDQPDFVRGWWLDGEYTASVHLLTALRSLAEATNDPAWREMYYRFLREKSPNNLDRKESIANGPKDLAHWSAWFLSNCQYAVRELYLSETDPAIKEIYRQSLLNTAQKAQPLLVLYRTFKNEGPRPAFNPDWHLLMPPYNVQTNGNEAQKLALEQNKVWGKFCPAINEEKGTLKPAFCAAWIVVLSGDPAMQQAAMPEIERMIAYPDYTRLYYATFFYAENLINTVNRLPKNAQQ